MKITGLNIDCLENVFEYLGFDDLLNVAAANKRLNKAANFVYDRKYRHQRVGFRSPLSKHNDYYDDESDEDGEDEENTFTDLRTSLKFIRCFGHLVHHIICDFFGKNPYKAYDPHDYEYDNHILNYISEYCSESLKKIDIRSAEEKWHTHMEKSFTKIEYVKLTFCELPPRNRVIFRLFPTVQNLDVGFDKDCIEANHFPQLKTLKIEMLELNDDMAPFLRSNPQIQFLSLDVLNWNSDSGELSKAFEALESLETFDAHVHKVCRNSVDNVVDLKKVKTLSIAGQDGTKLPFLFSQLDSLTMGQEALIASVFFRFIDQLPTIRHLRFTHEPVKGKKILQLAKSLPLLESIYLDVFISFRDYKQIIIHSAYTAEDIDDFVTNFKHLERIEFKHRNINFDHFKTLYANEWKCRMIGEYFICLEKLKRKCRPAEPTLPEPKKIKRR